MFKRNHPDRDVIFFGSVCSGIEAASVAWSPLGWKAAWLSEIEPFPSAVLAHHYPETPNLGDMTALPARILAREVPAPDVFCGGTPCQAFSVAGLRRSLDDARGNLSLTFCEIADAIDTVRADDGEQPAVIFWENVPGVLSTSDNAFGCFLAGLAGEDDPLVPEPCPPAGKSSRYWKWNKATGMHSLGWPVAGCVFGPTRAVAWRVTDAQYFGVAQRRRRVFVVASARDWFDPAAVLFEFEGVRRDTAPSRETREEVAGTVTAGAFVGGAGGRPEGAAAGHFIASTGDVSHCLNAGGMGRQDYETETLVTHSLRGEGFDASKDGTGRGKPLVPVAVAVAHSVRLANTSSNGWDEVRLMGGDGQIVGALAAEPGMKQTCYVAQPADEPYTLAIRGRGDTYNLEYRQDGTANALLTPNGDRAGIGVGAIAAPAQPAMQVRRLTPRECERLQGFPDGYTLIPWRKKPAEECPDGPRYKALGNSWAVPNVRWIGKRIDMFIKLSNWIS